MAQQRRPATAREDARPTESVFHPWPLVAKPIGPCGSQRRMFRFLNRHRFLLT